MKIGIFGGTFDPVHRAHLNLALGFYRKLALDKLIFVPAGQPYHKQNISSASAQQRFEMLELAIVKHPELGIDSCEIDRQKPSYSVETLHYLRQKFSADCKLWWLIGADAFLQIDSWWHWQELPSLVNVAVASRPGFDCQQLVSEQIKSAWRKWQGEQDDVFSVGIIRYLNLPLYAVSSTEVRKQLENGKQPNNLVPREVLHYITQHHLYQNKNLIIKTGN